MRKIFTLLLLTLSFAGNARVFYVSWSAGNDANPGTISQPFKRIEFAVGQLAPGDTLYIRGGTHRVDKALSQVNRIYIQNKNGNVNDSINIWNYPGEFPVVNYDDQVIPGSAGDGAVGMKIENCSYVSLKGLRITGLIQPNGSNSPAGLILYNCDRSRIRNVEVDNIQGYGIYIQNSSDNNHFLNVDAHHIADPFTGYEGANGFNCTGGDLSTNILFEGCRAWWCADDGFDLFGVNGVFTFKNCWSFWNGYLPGTFTHPANGDGQGFKLGPCANNQSANMLRTLNNCLSFENWATGYDQNSGSGNTCRMTMYNCVAYNNGQNGFFFGANTSIQQNFKNNISNTGVWGSEIQNGPNVSNNSWNGGVTLTNGDFISVNSAGVDGPRQADGSLPNLNYLKLITGSDLIDAGTNVGMPYNGAAPDQGAFETGTGGPPPPNQAPTANAGPDRTITLPTNNTTLNGSGTDPDGTIASYQWTKIAGPATFTIASPATAVTNITGLVQGQYTFRLTVTDNGGLTASDDVLVTVNAAAANQPPTANAGPDRNITLPTNNTTLNGSGTDPDGTIASYSWTKIAGPATFTIASPATAVTNITGLVQGQYTFRLTVTDNGGLTASDDVLVTVNAAPNQAPTANAGPNRNITLPTNNTTLNGSGTDPDGTIASYSWTKIAGPATFTIASPTTAVTNITGLVQGQYTFRLTVTDNGGLTAFDDVLVTVNAAPVNQAPTANAGPNRNITLPVNNTTLNGSGTDPDGTVTSYQWTKIAGPATFTIASPTTAVTNITGLVQGQYTFRLTVTDNGGLTDTDDVLVTVNAAPNQAPTADAGPNRTITLPVNNTTLNGSGTDPDGTIVSYQWTKIAGPAAFTIASPTTAVTNITGLVQGQYTFRLTVTDNGGLTDTDDVLVTVNAAPANQAPTANAGPDRTITLPANNTTLNGSGTDPDGTILSYQWTKIAGPAAFTIASPTTAVTNITGLVQGQYTFRLTVTDNGGLTDTDDVLVTVNAAPNQAPTADAGPNRTITLPANSATLNGSGTDPDGTIVSYQWTKIAGPVPSAIVSPNSAVTNVTGLAEGQYLFRLTVTDNGGLTDTDDVIVTVNAAPNQAPTANAGPDRTITLPANNATLTGSGTDPGGFIASYQWTKIAGPTSFTIVSPNSAVTDISGLVQGQYTFRLTVTDNTGLIDTDDVIVIVNAAPNQRPIANAGADQTIVLPANSVTLNGAGTDPDGTITSYQWTWVSGPQQYEIVSPGQAQTVVSGLAEGVYEFQLTVTDNRGATGTDIVRIAVVLPSESKAKLYPNPATGSVINIQINAATITNVTDVVIYDVRGIIVHKEQFFRNQRDMTKQIDVNKLPKGTYFLSVGVDINNTSTLKFVKL
jgi:hypothetical protein